ncbi:MAG TPA: methylenetetrahydrofolate reductase [Steroidobacteraceae bacterium]|nr:methylenetetrahydrofolate reductase [Steroidobacteraceae bacterium]
MTGLAQKIRARRFVVTTELNPPKGIDLSDLYAKADALRGVVDAFNLTESPRARMAIDPRSVGRLLQDRGVEPIVQVTARDRNRIAIQADLLGAAALGLGNFVFMSGDSPRNGDHPDAKPVFDLTASDMLRAARSLTQGKDLTGNELKGTPSLFIGATVNPASSKFTDEVENTRRKIDAGAEFFQTQAIYDPALLEKFLDAAKPDGVAILAGIIPLKSIKMATWLNTHVPGIVVPQALLDELASVSGAEAELAKGIEIAQRSIRSVRSLCSGVHMMALGWEAHIPAILGGSGAGS